MKQKGIIITISGILLFTLSALDLFAEKRLSLVLTVPLFLTGVAAAFTGPAFSLFSIPLIRRQKIARGIFVFSFVLIFIGICCAILHVPGARLEIMFGTLMLSFTYGTLALKNKYDKWKEYTRSRRDAFFLSLFDFLGVGALVLGFLFKIQHWPWAEQLVIIGMIVIAVGTIAWNQKFKKEVVFRKETEDKLKMSLDEIASQHQKLEEKQKEIIDSITYAKRIQNSILPTEKYIDSNLKRLKK